MGKREKVNMRFLIPAILFIWLMGGGISQATETDADFSTGTDSYSTPLGFVKSIPLPTIQNNVTLDKEGNIYVNNDGGSGTYIYKYSPDGTLINTYLPPIYCSRNVWQSIRGWCLLCRGGE